ncbi:MAG TPA: hypothetical protein VL281_06110 [Mycobacteriales bacterium]|nr:hypothetical protein [Mycobacteriales bacterium]
MSRSLLTRGALGVAAVALAATACGSSANGSTAAPSPSMSSTSATTETAAAALRAGLTGLLRQHVDLTAFAVQDLVAKGSLDDARVKGSLSALNDNTNALGDAIGSLYGDAAKTQFLKLWNDHIGFFVTYIKGDLTHSAALKKQANTQLDGYRAGFGAFVESATNKALPADAVAQELVGHIQTLEAAIDAIVAKSPKAPELIGMAADHMDGTAKALAGGIATAKSLAGDAGGDGSGLRAALTGLLVQHVAATGVVIQTVAETGSLTGARTVGAVAALTANTNALGDAIGGLYGPAAKTEFLKQWNAHIGFFVTYTKGVVGKDAKMRALANKQLDGYRAQFGAFIEGATNKALPADAVAQELVGHIQTLEAAIDAIVAGKANASSLLSMAEMHMPGTAAALAKGIATAKPDVIKS